MNGVTYFAGGFDPQKPNNNKASETNLGAKTFTQWDSAGSVVAQRPLTAAEIADLTAQGTEGARLANLATIAEQAGAALAANSTYLAIGSPINAQVAAQIRALTQQNNKIIRLLLSQIGDRSQLDATS